jgi:phage major head subunit gpT-like protein
MTADTQVALFTDFREKYNDWFFAAQNVNAFTDFCEVLDSTTLIENLNFLETIPQFREWTDERALQGIGPSYNYSIKNKHWEVTIEIDRDTIFDNRLQLERQKVAHLGLEAGRAPWQMFVNSLTANGLGYDGIAYYSTAHTQNGQANQSNSLTGTGTTVAALSTDFGTAKAAMRNFLDGQGRPMNLGQHGLHVLAPPALEQQWLQILNGDFIVTSVTSGVFGAETNWLKGAADLTIDPYLTDTDDWYLFATAEPGMPMIYANRQAPEFVAQDNPEAEANFMRRMLRYGADWRSQVGYGPWYLSVRIAAD